ncbi:unnamed protein product [Debaryomyces tyrocola]|nr:unnamed protein product [Debaryomyces tyrocola]
MGLLNYALVKEHSELMELMLLLTSAYTRTPNSTSYDDDRVILIAISQISGLGSLIVWLLVQIPQLIENHLNRSVQGLSLLLVIFWIGGDVSNFVGSMLNGAPFQICIGAYHCCIGSVLGVQYWYYTNVYPRLLKVPNELQKNISLEIRPDIYESKLIGRANRFEQREEEGYSRLQNLYTPRNGGFVDTVLRTSLSTSALIQSSNASPIAFDKDLEMPSNSLASKKVNEVLSAILFALSSSLGKIISFRENTTPAWICSLFYVCSRPPQIIQNYKAKSTSGLSLYTFLLAMIGNLLYVISIASSSYILFKKDIDAFNAMMSMNMPYMISSLLTFFFDTLLLVQCLYYDGSNIPTNSLNSGFLTNNLIFMQYDDENINEMNNPGYRHPRTGKGKQKKRPIYHDESSLHFQTPAWYTNNLFITDPNEDRYEATNTFFINDSRKNPRELSSQNETTSLLNNAINYTLTTPPAHYISRSILERQNQLSSQTIPNSVANSTSRNGSVNAVKSASMSALNSIISNGNGNNAQYNISILNTSLIPSIVSNYSSISKKLSHDSKTPFLPSDFLSDNFYNRSENASVSSNNMQ